MSEIVLGNPVIQGNGEIVHNYTTSATSIGPGLGLSSTAIEDDVSVGGTTPFAISGYFDKASGSVPGIKAGLKIGVVLKTGESPAIGGAVYMQANGTFATSGGTQINAKFVSTKGKGINIKDSSLNVDDAAYIEILGSL